MTAKPLRRFTRRFPIGASLSAALIALAGISLVAAISEIVHGVEAGLLFQVLVVSLALGWCLAPLLGHTLSGLGMGVLSCLLFLWVRLGNLAGVLFQAIQQAAGFLSPPPRSVSPQNVALLAQNLGDLSSRTRVMLDRVAGWGSSLIQGHPRYDIFANAFFWCCLTWVTLFWAAWAARRRNNPLVAMLPSLGLLATSLAYTNENPGYLIVLASATLFLSVLVHHRSREKDWEARRLDFSEDLRYDTASISVTVILILTALTLVVPSVSVKAIADKVRTASQASGMRPENAGRPFGLVPRPGTPAPLPAYYHPGLPASHLLTGGPELGQEKVMEVRLSVSPESETTAAENQAEPPAGEAYYWRALTYDVYTGHGWQTGPTTETVIPAGAAIESLDPQRYRLVFEQVSQVQPAQGLVYSAGELSASNQALHAVWRSEGDLFTVFGVGEEYQANAWVPAFPRDELAQAGGDIPGWIAERYLQLPGGVPGRVLGLARDLTSSEATPYDQALAIQAYLRRIPYSLDLPDPPADQDVVDYFLFSLKRGYCDYYASAMVVLARAVGIPARLASGYASGTYDPQTGVYLVTQADAHSWPEIYFPGYGWVAFEPTAAIAAFGEQDGAAYAPRIQPSPASGGSQLSPVTREKASPAAVLFLLLVLGLSIYWIIRWRRWRRHCAAVPARVAIFRLYRSMRRMAAWWNCPNPASDTPLEFMQRFSRLTEPPPGSRWAAADRQTANHTTQGVVLEGFYAADPPDPARLSAALKTWEENHQKLWWQGFVKRVQLLFPRKRNEDYKMNRIDR